MSQSYGDRRRIDDSGYSKIGDAVKAHEHAGGDITSGAVSIDRLPKISNVDPASVGVSALDLGVAPSLANLVGPSGQEAETREKVNEVINWCVVLENKINEYISAVKTSGYGKTS